jgi:predicted dehydrogenase
MVGYNRRFSPDALSTREAFAARVGPMAIQYAVAAGPTPRGTWLTDPEVGGGRVIGEVCHFIDLCTFLVGETPVDVTARALSRNRELDDSMIATVSYPDGSIANISYLANADGNLPKERWEVHADGKSILCENFKTLRMCGGSTRRKTNQDKGQRAAIREILRAVAANDPSPLTISELVSTSAAALAASGGGIFSELLDNLAGDDVNHRPSKGVE